MSINLPSRGLYGSAVKDNKILSATPAQLILQLYNALVGLLKGTETALAEKKIEQAHHTLRRAERIIIYLNSILNDEGGAVSDNLRRLYQFSLRHLQVARLTLEPERVAEVRQVVERLHEAWQQIAADGA